MTTSSPSTSSTNNAPFPAAALLLRPEIAADDDAIERLHQRAFGPGRFARTAFRLREGTGSAERLGFTAHIGTFLAGSVRMMPVLAGRINGVMLGPLTVDPAFEGRGVGGRLMVEAIKCAKARHFGVVLLVGDLEYYSRFGFASLAQGRLVLPGPVDPSRFLALELHTGALAEAKGQVKPLRRNL